MVIDVVEAAKAYVEGAKAKADKLVRKYVAVTDKIGRLTTDKAIENWKERVVSDIAVKLRTRNLKELTDEDLNKAMREKGKTAYITAVGLAEDKYRERFDPYAKEIDLIIPKLKPKEVDARTNVLNRVVPLAVGLQNKKKKILGIT